MSRVRLGNSILYRGDCLEVMEKLPDKSIQLVLCDLPYGTTDSSWDKIIPSQHLWRNYERVIKDNGSILLFASGMFAPRLLLSNLPLFKYQWVWVKNNSTNFVHAKNRPMSKCEYILVFSKAPMGHVSQLGDKRMLYNPQGLIPYNKTFKAGKNRFGTVVGVRPSHKEEIVREFTNYPTDVLTDYSEEPSTGRLHTNQKPVPLLEYFVKTYTNENDIVMDNCMGSGSTGVACVNTSRKFIGIELEEKYFGVAVDRIKQSIHEKSIREGEQGHEEA